MVSIDVLRELPLFARLHESALEVLAKGARVRSYEVDQTLWIAGEPAWGLYVLLDGCIRILRLKDGRQSVVHRVSERGATLGEVPLFDGRGYPATAVAEAPTGCVVIDVGTLRAAVRADPALAESLLARMSDRVRELVERVELMTTDTVRARLASWLLLSSSREDGRWIARYRSQQLLAEDLGTVREVVARELSRMRQRGAISSARGRVEILDRRLLRRYGGGDGGVSEPVEAGREEGRPSVLD